MRAKFPVGQIGIAQVAARQAPPADADLPGFVLAYDVPCVVQNQDFRIVDRIADRIRPAQRRTGHLMAGREDRRFGRAVVIDQRVSDVVRIDRSKFLASREKIPEGKPRGLPEGNHVRDQHGRHIGMRDPVADEETDQRVDVEARFVVGQEQGRARRERRPDLPLRDVESQACHRRRAALAGHRETRVVPTHERGHGGMLDDHALGDAGGTGCEDHVERAAHRAAVQRRARPIRPLMLRVQLRDADERVGSADVRLARRQCQRRGAFTQDVLPARVGVTIVDRYVRGARLQHPEYADDEVRVPPRLDRNQTVRHDSARRQCGGDPVAASIQFIVIKRLVLRNHCRCSARERHVGPESFQHVQIGGHDAHLSI